MLYCYACCCCYHYYLCMSLVVPLVLNIVYGSYSLSWPINIADMNIYIYIYIMLPQWPPVCHEFATKTQPCFFKRIRRLCRRLLPTYDFGSVLRHINRRVRESEGEIQLIHHHQDLYIYISGLHLYMVINHPQKNVCHAWDSSYFRLLQVA